MTEARRAFSSDTGYQQANVETHTPTQRGGREGRGRFLHELSASPHLAITQLSRAANLWYLLNERLFI